MNYHGDTDEGTTDRPASGPADHVRNACHEIIAALPDEAIPEVTRTIIEMLQRHREKR